MYSLQPTNARIMEDHKVTPPTVKTEPQQPQGPSPPFGFFAHPLMPSSQPHFQQQMGGTAGLNPIGTSAGSSSTANFPFPQMLFHQLAASRGFSNNSPHSQLQQKPGPSSSANSGASSSASPAAQLLNSTNNNNITPFPGAPFPATGPGNSAALQQQLHQNLLLFQQQQQQMQQRQQQQHSQSQSPKQQSPPTVPDPMAQQQFWMQFLLAAMAGAGAGANNGMMGGIAQQLQTSGADNSGNVGALSAEKKLERAPDGSAICPACREPIGNNSAEWAKHLELEKAKLQKAIQTLKEKSQVFGMMVEQQQQQNAPPTPNPSEERFRRDGILQRIRENQQKRIDAKLKGQLQVSLSMSSLVNSSGTVKTEASEQQLSPAVEPMENGDKNLNTSENGELSNGTNGKHICVKCNCHSEFLVLNVGTKMLQCLDCFQQQRKKQNLVEDEQKPNGNGLPLPLANNRKRISPPFSSALGLAAADYGQEDGANDLKRPKMEG